jgi:hypothetical protein
MPIDPQDGGLDDWIAPTPTPNLSDGPDDWIAPANAHRDPYPDDWIAPAPSAASSAIQPAAGPQPSSANPGVSKPPAARPDPLAAYWASIPASRAGAMAWHPPIFLNSPGQSPLPAPAPLDPPWTGPRHGLLAALANSPGPNTPSYGLLGGLPNLPSANPAALRSFQPIELASGNGDQPALPPLFSSLADLPSSPPPTLLDTMWQVPILDAPFDVESNARPRFIPSTLNFQPASPSASPFLQATGSVSGKDDSSAQLSSPSVPGLDQLGLSTQSIDDDNSGNGSSAESPSDSDDARSITRLVRDSAGRALAIIHVRPAPSVPSSESDATPDALHPGAKYAQINKNNNAKTGNPVIDRTTDMLLDALEESVLAMGPGSGARFGMAVHVDFANRVRRLDLPGIGQKGVEQGFHLNPMPFIRYGLADSIRTDVTLRNPKDPNQRPIAVYDLKTGNAVLTPGRVKEILDKVNAPGLFVIELQYRTGQALDRTMTDPPR